MFSLRRASFLLLAVAPLVTAGAQAPSPQGAASDPRVILTRRCIGCHSGDSPQGGLDLTTRDRLLKGSPAHVVVRPGNSAGSVLIQRVATGTMPPGGRLPAGEVEALRKWVDAALPWEGGQLQPVRASAQTRAGSDWWSLQPLRVPTLPPVAAVTEPGMPALSLAIDAFVDRRLKEQGLRFSPPASRRELIRRLTYDLHGVPPTDAEVTAFERDRRPDACRRLVDRLLASPRFGERIARHWLDVARFAESDGYEHDLPRPTAWPYRDWVIDAFNRDLPYDRFVAEQIAGDALHPDDRNAAVPTGFLVAGGFDEVGAKGASPMMRAEVRQDELEDMVGTSMQVLLGLSAQCARCHDHKFDPIPQKDYYRLTAVFSGARHWEAARKTPLYAVSSEAPAPTFLLRRGSVATPGEPITPGVLSALSGVPDPTAALSTNATDRERRLALSRWLTDARNPLLPRVMANRIWGWFFGQGIVATPNDFGFNGARPTHPELLEFLAASFAAGAGVQGSGFLGQDSGRKPGPGTNGQRARTARRNMVAPPPVGGRREPLPPRVSWSVKSLVRAIVLSRAYRQTSRYTSPVALAKDPDDLLLWRHRPRRLEAEELRDTLLLAAGKLNERRGGPGYELFTWKDNAGALYQPRDPDDPECYRRAIYRMVVRGGEDPLLTSFDCPDPSSTSPRRQASTTAIQALSLLNNSFSVRMARFTAERLERVPVPTTDLEAQVRRSYRLFLNRDPLRSEVERAVRFSRAHGLPAWCRLLGNTSEFLTVE